ncbi:hypothetical protein [Pseudoxanthomonas sp. PXM02]|uniref:hypothetical protein n=1 Tax=Pseudoxanthomonas sp. PXM02 TaxID=2769294 RepID=UPI00178102C6|nr:hypothetical protein [Pseudoxanthomonas sp. PXM02]MBD9478209.1 hypothetical protein [Pseudoxanthomonas sp. PXM02]
MLTTLPTLDALLETHASRLGRDATGYRHHAYRVANFYWHLLPGNAEMLEKLSIAAAFHDLGIWTAHTFDYLPPSRALASEHLRAIGRVAWQQDVDAMIDHHHRIRHMPADTHASVEMFRRADWIDVSNGVLRFGLDRKVVREVRRMFPDAGFHRRLLQLTLQRLARHPLSPLPMMRW